MLVSERVYNMIFVKNNIDLFQTLGEAVLGKKKELDDVLAADYSYCILLVEIIRNITVEHFQNNLKSILENRPDVHENSSISGKCEERITKFKRRLEEPSVLETGEAGQRGVKRYPCITRDIFEKVVEYHQMGARENLEMYIDDLLSSHPDTSKNNFGVALFGYMIHYKKNDEIIMKIKQLIEHKPDYFDVDIAKARMTFVQKYETMRIVDDLIIPKDAKALEGKMKILRVSYIKNGNTLYTTLCIARQVASENKQYMFEVIRDFGYFRLRDINVTKCDRALFRIRRVLQTEHCQYTDPQTLEPCRLNCKTYKPVCPGLTCKNCGHVHKQINLYKDLKHLPVLLILQKRGRLGDTFPISFNCMDLRICYRDHVSIV